ncbi:unnamed protein product, partial [marine sediment metagenome]
MAKDNALNTRAAEWWAQWLPEHQRERFIDELVKRLLDGDF